MNTDDWRRVRRFASGRQHLLTADQALALGLSRSEVTSALRRGALRSLYKGVYLVDPDSAGELTDTQWRAAALLAHGPTAALAGWSAARQHGVQGLPPVDPSIDLVVLGAQSRHVRSPSPGVVAPDAPPIVVRQWVCAPEQIVMADGLRAVRAELAAVDAALQLDRVHALCLFDSVLSRRLAGRQELEAVVCGARRRPGVRHVREVLPWADERAQTPLETRVRLACIDGAVAPDELQYAVRDQRGRIVGFGDLAWLKRARPLIGEADGRTPHSAPAALLYDRRRSNEFVLSYCDIVRFTWADALQPIYIQQIVRAALAA